MSRLSFILEYISHPRTVGAIMPSSKYLAEKMVRSVNFETAEAIAEYGPGTGVFTDLLLKKRVPRTKIVLIERDKKFYEILCEKYADEPNMCIINDSAANIGMYMIQYELPHMDYIISGLPFASLPREISSNILAGARENLKPEGEFISFQYSLFKKDLIGKYFSKIEITMEFRNLPPAYVFCCSK